MEHRSAPRVRAVLKAEIRYNDGLMSAPCVVRDISATGARIELDGDLALPDHFDLHIAKKDVTHHATLKWRHGREVGLEFGESDANRPTEAADDGALADRVARLEREVTDLKRTLRKITAALPPR